MIINNQHLLENRKRGLRDPRLPLTPAVLLAAATTGLTYRRRHGCQGYALGPPATPEQGQWAGHITGGRRRLRRVIQTWWRKHFQPCRDQRWPTRRDQHGERPLRARRGGGRQEEGALL